MTDVRDNSAFHRFELETDGHTAYAYYQMAPGVITLTRCRPARRIPTASSRSVWKGSSRG